MLAVLCAGCTSIAADQRTFEGTRWHVTAINGQPTPTVGDYRLEFHDGELSGRFGCNSFGGEFTVANEALIARNIAATLMGCPEPSASLEQAGFRILGQPMRWTEAAGGRLSLRNSAGAIALERVL